MKEEREALMSHTWPALRQFCREREVEFVEVDLRWGISEEQSNRNETLQLGVGMTQLPLVGSWLSDNGGIIWFARRGSTGVTQLTLLGVIHPMPIGLLFSPCDPWFGDNLYRTYLEIKNRYPK